MRQDRLATRLCPPTEDATGIRNQRNKYQRTHNNAPPIYNGPATHQGKEDIFHTTELGWKKGPETYQNIIHLMQPQQFTVKTTWTQVLPHGRPGTFLPCLWSPSSVFVNHVFPTSSTAAVVSLSWPLAGEHDRQYTDNNKMRNKYKYSTTKENEIWTKKEKRDQAQARYPTTQTTLLSQER